MVVLAERASAPPGEGWAAGPTPSPSDAEVGRKRLFPAIAGAPRKPTKRSIERMLPGIRAVLPLSDSSPAISPRRLNA
jgi:hypothetical protein